MRRLIVTTFLLVITGLFAVGNCMGQMNKHYLHSGDTTPGIRGATRAAGGGDVVDYFQPVLIRTPKGTNISIPTENMFVSRTLSPMMAGLRIGSVYRARVTDIPLYPGREVYPSIELIDRTYPPRGEELKFPIILDITFEDIELALNGKLVTKVVYLESPFTAIPARGVKDARADHEKMLDPSALPSSAPIHGESVPLDPTLSFDIGPYEDPIAAADMRGRPVAIVRIGSRVPSDPGSIESAFLFDSPGWLGISPDGSVSEESFGFVPRKMRIGIPGHATKNALNEPPIPNVVHR